MPVRRAAWLWPIRAARRRRRPSLTESQRTKSARSPNPRTNVSNEAHGLRRFRFAIASATASLRIASRYTHMAAPTIISRR